MRFKIDTRRSLLAKIEYQKSEIEYLQRELSIAKNDLARQYKLVSVHSHARALLEQKLKSCRQINNDFASGLIRNYDD